MPTPGSNPSGQRGQDNPTELFRDLARQFADKSDQISQDTLRPQRSTLETTCDRIVTASGAESARLEEAGTHRQFTSRKQMPDWAKSALSKVMFLIDHPRDYGTDQGRVEDAITQQIQALSKVMSAIGVISKADADSYAASGSQRSGSQSSGSPRSGESTQGRQGLI